MSIWQTETLASGFASRPWLIVPVCAAIHATYAVAFLFDRGVAGITALSLVHALFGRFVWLALMAVAAAALVPMLVRMRSAYVHAFLWPQQAVLFMMAASALIAAFHGRYPDGVERSFIFIFSDQCYAVYLAGGHLAALLRNASLGGGGGRIL